ncbi:MAG TPA: hypothetical protein VFV38_20460 [Ktedonobacteraceae bacterium]|nr:hypothetical protein [Ktedonobacteraceae bacterium]
MHARIPSGTNSLKIVVTTLLILLLVGCGTDANSPSGVTHPQQATPSDIPSSLSAHSISIDIAHMHIYSKEAISCINYPALGTSVFYGVDNLVLNGQRLDYDPTEIQQMRSYIAAVYGSVRSPSIIPALPSTLRWVSGTTVSDYDGIPSNLLESGCYGEMDLTNTGSNPILIQSIQVQLTAPPVRINPSSQYRMIEICSLLIGTEAGNGCPPMAGGSSSVFEFFRFKPSSQDTVFTPRQQINDPQYQSGSDLRLDPSTQSTLPIIFYFSSLDGFSYSFEPQLILKTPNGDQQTVSLPQLATKVYFANPNQFPCYTLKGNLFVEMTNGIRSDSPNGDYCV